MFFSFFSHLFEVFVAITHHADDPGRHEEYDEHREEKGAAGRVDHVAGILVVSALSLIGSVSVRVRPVE